MLRQALLCLALAALAAGPALGGEDYFVAGVAKPVEVDLLRSAGLLYLADLGREYLVMGDDPAMRRLEASGAACRRLVSTEPGDEVYLLTARDFRSEMLYSGALTDLGYGKYLAVVRTGEMEDLRYVPFARERLLPRMFPAARRYAPPVAQVLLEARPEIEAAVEDVSQDSLRALISQLSGNEPVLIGGTMDTLYTRYSYSPGVDRAAEYLMDRLESYGIDAEYHYYAISNNDFFGADFVGADLGYIVGNDQGIFKTTDGGETWVRQDPGAPFQTFNGVCFVDTLTGWACGTGGRIYHTEDGGSSWTEQATPTTVTLRDIQFLDSGEGWVAGYAGVILHTVDGGGTWNGVTSGTSANLYGLHFDSPGRGWACGRDGEVLFWDGSAWTAQTSGTLEYLLDVYFADAQTGYMVGGGGTILKTVDGGTNWVPLSTPAESNPYLQAVCFADTLKGWVVGLGGTVLHTVDGGATWTEQPTYTLFGLRCVTFIDGNEGWALGYGGTILHTVDAGATWVNQRENLPSGAVIFWKNVVGTKQGAASEEQVVICGHFDSISDDPMNRAPGADDNASGTAAVVEAARVLGPMSFEKTIKFLCFSGEEQGMRGSGEYAAEARMRGDAIAGVLNFDMIGYVDAAPEDIDLIVNPASEWLGDFAVSCAGAYVPGLPALKLIDPSFTLSDHSPFWNSGYDALLGIEDRDLSYPYYHTVNDTLGNITMAFAADVTRMGVATVAELAVLDTTASVAGGGVAGTFSIRVSPNPVIGSAGISFALASTSRVEAGVFDVEGRLVRGLLVSTLQAGPHEVTWDGRGARGRQVSPGIYFVQIGAEGRRASSKIMILR